MILQKVIKGISGIDAADARPLFEGGIKCNWWRKVHRITEEEKLARLTAKNLQWHQNRYDDPDPDEHGESFGKHTPFISTTAGTVERDFAMTRNVVHPAWQIAMEFATDGWRSNGCLFYCYVFILGRQSIAHNGFSEEVRDLNIYTSFSPFQPEGEVTAKIVIPPIQIEKFEYYDVGSVLSDIRRGRRPSPVTTDYNANYVRPETIANMRDLLV